MHEIALLALLTAACPATSIAPSPISGTPPPPASVAPHASGGPVPVTPAASAAVSETAPSNGVRSAARVFEIDNASKELSFRLSLRDGCPGSAAFDDACAGAADLVVLRKSDGSELQRLELDDAWVAIDRSGAALVDTSRLYDVQGTIDVGDFDFDGHEDFAIQADQSGPYGGPTFRVFLYAPAASKFVLSESLSQLTEDNLGMFQVDTRREARSEHGAWGQRTGEDTVFENRDPPPLCRGRRPVLCWLPCASL